MDIWTTFYSVKSPYSGTSFCKALHFQAQLKCMVCILKGKYLCCRTTEWLQTHTLVRWPCTKSVIITETNTKWKLILWHALIQALTYLESSYYYDRVYRWGSETLTNMPKVILVLTAQICKLGDMWLSNIHFPTNQLPCAKDKPQ